jgi:hypothetical protein
MVERTDVAAFEHHCHALGRIRIGGGYATLLATAATNSNVVLDVIG